jgi:transcriptional regulator with XRE-family HTH domain
MASENAIYTEFMRGRAPKTTATEYGSHLAELRRLAGLSQVEVAEALDIPQRTVSFYERKARYLPSNLIQPLAQLLGVPIEEILGVDSSAQRKRGPKSRLERQFEAILRMPPSKQQFISKLLGEIIGTQRVESSPAAAGEGQQARPG